MVLNAWRRRGVDCRYLLRSFFMLAPRWPATSRVLRERERIARK
jgi:hypothetical protein